MNMNSFAATAALCLASAASAATSTQDSFNKMKGLVGTWEQKSGDHTFRSVYRLTGAGSALMETLGPDTPEEMVSMYHMDNDRLLLTHYCAAQNQPTLKLVPSSDPSLLHFVFVSGTNMKPSDMHIHDLKIRFIDKNHIKEDWQAYMDGKPGSTMSFDFHRAGPKS